MLVQECMSKKVVLGNPDMKLQEVAQKMRDGDFGFLPIAENDRLVGIITDRDIAIRAVATGSDPKQVQARDIMSKSVLYCYDDQSIEEVLKNLGEQQVRRLPVLNRKKRLVGILSIGDLARKDIPADILEDTLSHICSSSEKSQDNMYMS